MVQEIKEEDLYPVVTSAERFKGNLFFHQVPVADWTECTKRIDLITLEDGKVVAIELKVSDWRDAFHQAFRNLFASDLSFVALWHRHFRSLDRSMFEKCGVGLIELNGTARVMIQARNSQLTIPERREYLLTQCLPERVYQKS